MTTPTGSVPEGGSGAARDEPFAMHLFRDPSGRPVATAVDERCDMLRFLRARRGGTMPLFDYLRTGREALAALQHALRWCGRTLADGATVLDFACGYGRLTRWLVHLGRERVFASDVELDAVRFVDDTFGVRAFASAAGPDAVELPQDLDVIWVGSLFTHLPRRRFDAWLARLLGALAPDGVLLFTMHGTRSPTPEFVLAAAARAGAAHVTCTEHTLWGQHDLYVAGARPLPVHLPSVPWPRGRIEGVRSVAPGSVALGGSCRFPAGAGDGLRIEVHGDGGAIAEAARGELVTVAGREPRRDRELGLNWWIEGPLPDAVARDGRLAVVAVTSAGAFPLDAVDLRQHGVR